MRRVQGGGRPPGREQRLLDVYNERPVRLSAKVSIPVREHPKVADSFLSQKSPETGIPVQLCGQAARPPRQFVEAATGGDDDEDGGAGTRIHEEQATRGGAEELDRPKAQPSQVSNSIHKKIKPTQKNTTHKSCHLREELHVEITAFASPAEAHARLAFALTEVGFPNWKLKSTFIVSQVRKYLIPDSNDQIRQQQMREIQVKLVKLMEA